MEPEVRARSPRLPSTLFSRDPVRGSRRHDQPDPNPSPPPPRQPSPEEVMRQQEEKLRAKYGDLKPKKKLIHKVRAGKPRRRKRHRTHSSRCSTPRMRRAYSFSRSFTLTHRNRALHSHAHEQDVKYFDSADYSLQQVRAVRALAVCSRPRARAEHHSSSSSFAHPKPNSLSLSSSRVQQDKEHHRGEEDVRTLPVKMGSSPPKSNMSK